VEVAATQQRLHQICDMEVSGRRKILDVGQATGGALVEEKRSVRRGKPASRAAKRMKKRSCECGGAGKEERTRESWWGMGYPYRGQGSQ
jgi:hypothetical protein